ncbi:MAG TPA: hypothetical protein VF175_13745 [Lacipirellula sp.]
MRQNAHFSPRCFSVVLLFALATIHPGEVQAGEPVLAFDLGRTIEARDITPHEFSELYPDSRIIEATVRVSVRLESGDIADVSEIRVEINDHDGRLRVHDFAPRTRLESEYAEAIETTTTVESHNSFSASLGGEIPCLGGTVAHLTPTIGGELGGKEIVTEKAKRVPPMQAVVASGTINEEHGVFFTLRASPTGTLEGVHELTVQFVVPAKWRGDAVRITCQASGQQKVLWIKQQAVWGYKSTPVALYLAGDAVARRAAMRFVERQ